jgi:cytochrome c oxidase cbb3-type subunit III
MTGVLNNTETPMLRYRMLVVPLAVAALAACGAEPRATKVGSGASPASTTLSAAGRPLTVAEQGRVLFMANNCVSCHGGLAGGGMGPSLRDSVWKYGSTDSSIYNSIHDGRPMGMPAWGPTLSATEIKTIMAYVRTIRTPDEPKFFWVDTAASPAR